MPSTAAETRVTKTNPHIFLLEGEAEGAPGLRCAHCARCGRFTIGRVPICSHCFSREVTEVAGGRRAELVEYSIARHPAGGFAAPYAIGQVRTSEGMTLFAPLVGETEGLAPGRALAFTLVDHGDGTVGFAFRPAAPGEPA